MARFGEGQPAALPPADHGLDGVAEEPACSSGVVQFARAVQVFPGDFGRSPQAVGKAMPSWWENESEASAFHLIFASRRVCAPKR